VVSGGIPTGVTLGVAYLYSLFIAQLTIRPLFKTGYRQLGGQAETSQSRWQPAAVGYLERALYTSAWVVGRPELAAVWLALKVAGQWGRWQVDRTLGTVQIQGRSVYNLFLLGSGLSLAFAFAGGLVVEPLAKGAYLDAIAIALGPVALTAFLSLLAAGRLEALGTPRG
jgi:hypothetical protein